MINLDKRDQAREQLNFAQSSMDHRDRDMAFRYLAKAVELVLEAFE